MQWLFLTFLTVYAEPDSVDENGEESVSEFNEIFVAQQNPEGSEENLNTPILNESVPESSESGINEFQETESQVLNTEEITQLLDQLKWDDVVRESLKLVDSEPENAKAYLTLGDALSRYPSDLGEGNIYKAYDVWTMAQSLTADKDTNKSVAERIDWAIELSGSVELNAVSEERRPTFDDSFSFMLRSESPVDWRNRAERNSNSTTIINIPTGKSVLKVYPSEDLPVLVYTVTLEPGENTELEVPVDELSMEKILQDGVLKDISSDNIFRLDEGGDYVLDSFIQKSIENPEFTFKEFNPQMVKLPKAPIPSDSIVIFHGPDESIQYDNGIPQTIAGGLYVVSVEKKGIITYGDMVVHKDLTIKHIRDFTLRDDLRRSTVDSPHRAVKIKPRFFNRGKDAFGLDTDGEFSLEINGGKGSLGKGDKKVTFLRRNRGDQDGSDSGSGRDGRGKSDSEESPEEKAKASALLEEKREKGKRVLEDLDKLSAEELEDIEPIMANYKGIGSLQRWVMYGLIGSTSYTGLSFLRANSFAKNANSEKSSQRNFNDYQSKSESWGQRYQVGLLVSTTFLASYVTSVYIDRRLLVTEKSIDGKREVKK